MAEVNNLTQPKPERLVQKECETTKMKWVLADIQKKQHMEKKYGNKIL